MGQGVGRIVGTLALRAPERTANWARNASRRLPQIARSRPVSSIRVTPLRTIMPRPHEPVARPLGEGAEPGRIDERSFFEAGPRRTPGRAGWRERRSLRRPPRPTGRCGGPQTVEDQDACALYAAVRKDGKATHDVIEKGFVALQKMLHRAGNVDGEGDGCGVMIDIPRLIWQEEVRHGRPRAAPGARPRVRGRARLRLARRRLRAGQAARAPDPPSRRPARAGRARGPRRRARRSGPTAREEEPHFWQVGVLVPDAEARDRILFDVAIEIESDARRTRRLAVGGELRLQGDGRAAGAAGLLRRPLRPALRDRLAARPQPLLDEHVAVVHARAAVLGPRPQRRDQHDRAPARRVAHARRADPRRLLRLAGPEPADRDADPPARPVAAGGDGAGRAADRERDPPVPRGPARLLHVPAPGDGPVRAGPDRADRAPRRRARVLGRRARPAPAVADRGARLLRVQLRAGRRAARRHDRRAQAAVARARR